MLWQSLFRCGEFKRRSRSRSPFAEIAGLERLNVLSLPALGSLGHFELHRLALLQASEAARLDCREVHKNIFAVLPADKAVAFGVVKPLYCSLFCHVVTGVPFNQFTLDRLGGTAGRLLAVEARTAHDRFGLTYKDNGTRIIHDWQADLGSLLFWHYGQRGVLADGGCFGVNDASPGWA